MGFVELNEGRLPENDGPGSARGRAGLLPLFLLGCGEIGGGVTVTRLSAAAVFSSILAIGEVTGTRLSV